MADILIYWVLKHPLLLYLASTHSDVTYVLFCSVPGLLAYSLCFMAFLFSPLRAQIQCQVRAASTRPFCLTMSFYVENSPTQQNSPTVRRFTGTRVFVQRGKHEQPTENVQQSSPATASAWCSAALLWIFHCGSRNRRRHAICRGKNCKLRHFSPHYWISAERCAAAAVIFPEDLKTAAPPPASFCVCSAHDAYTPRIGRRVWANAPEV